MPSRWTRRVATSIATSTYRRRSTIVSMWKKSMANRPVAWLRRNVRQRVSCSQGGGPTRRRAQRASPSHAARQHPQGDSRGPASRRQSYANDLGDSRPLVAVTDNVNQADGGQDPATWMPPYSSAHCRYINEWVATKIRWRFTVDTTEKKALTSWANSCPNVTITVVRAF